MCFVKIVPEAEIILINSNSPVSRLLTETFRRLLQRTRNAYSPIEARQGSRSKSPTLEYNFGRATSRNGRSGANGAGYEKTGTPTLYQLPPVLIEHICSFLMNHLNR